MRGRPRLCVEVNPVTPSSRLDGADLSLDPEVPPVVTCGICGQTSCQGCEASSAPDDGGERTFPPWERSGRWGGSGWWETALMSADEPEEAFGIWTRGPRLLGAFMFALLCELTAVASLGLPVALVLGVFVPRALAELAGDPMAWAWFALLALGGALGMVALHAVWGVIVEWSLERSGHPAQHRSGFRLGMYACGWDLITSPAGFAIAVTTQGPSGAFDLLRRAAAVPRRAMVAYLERARGLSPDQQKAVLRRAGWTVFASFGVLSVLLGAWTIVWVWRQLTGS